MPRRKALSSLLIKPAGPDCNLACGYCFYRDKEALFAGTQARRMSDEVLEETIRQALAQNIPAVSFGWQGGEPTLMGLPFFEKAVRLQSRHGRGQSVGNGLQTNGLLLDRRWAAFLRDYQFLVGLSLDGPEHVHDAHRVRTGGQPTWAEAVDRAKMLLDAGVDVNALSVVNSLSARFPDETYGFFKSLGLTYMQFIPCVETDPADPGRAIFRSRARPTAIFSSGFSTCGGRISATGSRRPSSAPSIRSSSSTSTASPPTASSFPNAAHTS
jgi:uncharacterized protein